MKILQINAVNGIRSTGRTCTEMSQYFTAAGWTCHTAYSVGNRDHGGIPFANASECKYHALMSRISGKQGYHSPISTKKLLKTIKQLQPDVVVLRNLHANYLNIVPLLRYLGKHEIPTVVVLHDCWLFTGKCTHYTAKGCQKWQSGCHHCSQLKSDHKSWLLDRTAAMWRDKCRGFQKIPRLTVVGVSDWITNEAKKSPFFTHAQFRRIYNWINMQTFCPGESDIKLELGIEGKQMILGVSSRWSEKKGLQDFLSLAHRLDENTKIVLLGSMPRIDLPENVIHIPETTDVAQLVQIYRAADVLLQLSREETFGKVVAEALCCGTPVVTNTCTANPELVNNSCGIVLEDLSTDAIAAAIEEILRNGKSAYTDSCIAFARTHFDKQTNLSQYRELFSLLCKCE